MAEIQSDSQLNLFSHIRSALIANSVLLTKFNIGNIYQYEPKHKSTSFNGFPYIWINLPETPDNKKLTMSNSVRDKMFTVPLILRMDYMVIANIASGDKFKDYCNAIIDAIESYDSTFQDNGYYDVEIELQNVDPSVVINQKELVEGIFEIRFHGKVNY